jgi:hypothetical protein
MRTMFKQLLVSAIVALFLTGGVAFAAKVGMFGGPNSSGTAAMEVDDARAITVASDATFTIENDLVVSDDLGVTGDITVDTDIYANKGVIVDGSIYLATTDGGTAGFGLYVSQPDGGCSKCKVDAAGTTFSCTDVTCPAGMN